MYSTSHKKEGQREADRRYRLRHPDRCRERDRKWRTANPDKRKAQKRRNYQRHRAEILAQKRRYYIERRVWERRRQLFAVDSTAYANFRAAMRIRKAKRRIMGGKLYWPRYARRIPDWATMCHAAWAASPWLPENLTPSQRGYARELAIERKGIKTGDTK
jgi:hypothetical protein